MEHVSRPKADQSKGGHAAPCWQAAELGFCARIVLEVGQLLKRPTFRGYWG